MGIKFKFQVFYFPFGCYFISKLLSKSCTLFLCVYGNSLIQFGVLSELGRNFFGLLKEFLKLHEFSIS